MSYTKEQIRDCENYIKELELAQMHVEDMDQFEQIEVDIDRTQQQIDLQFHAADVVHLTLNEGAGDQVLVHVAGFRYRKPRIADG